MVWSAIEQLDADRADALVWHEHLAPGQPAPGSLHSYASYITKGQCSLQWLTMQIYKHNTHPLSATVGGRKSQTNQNHLLGHISDTWQCGIRLCMPSLLPVTYKLTLTSGFLTSCTHGVNALLSMELPSLLVEARVLQGSVFGFILTLQHKWFLMLWKISSFDSLLSCTVPQSHC